MTFKNWYKNLNIKRKNKLVNEITNLVTDIYIRNKCPKCERILPNKYFFTKNGCIWCDSQWHWNKLKIKKLGEKT